MALIDDGWTDLFLFSAITDSDFDRLGIVRGGDRARVRRIGTSETGRLFASSHSHSHGQPDF